MLTRKMKQRKKVFLGFMAVLSAITLASMVQAQQPLDITEAFFATYKPLLETKELAILGSEVWGIVTSNNENKAFEDMTSYCLAVRKFVAGEPRNSLTYTKFMDKDGDFIVVETIRDGTETGPEATWTFIQGTGKWNGWYESYSRPHL